LILQKGGKYRRYAVCISSKHKYNKAVIAKCYAAVINLIKLD
jgi:hypothetical protein